MTDTSRWTDSEWSDDLDPLDTIDLTDVADLVTKKSGAVEARIPAGQHGGGRWTNGSGGGSTGASNADKLGHGRAPGQHLHATIPNTGAQTPFDQIDPRYRASMDKRMAKLGLDMPTLEHSVESALDRGDATHANWYPKVHEAITTMAARHGVTPEQAAGVVAAMSPAREFGKNLRDADTLMAVMHENKPFTPHPDNVKAFNARRNTLRPYAAHGETTPRALDPSQVGLHPVLAKLGNTTGLDGAIRGASILKGASADKILGGPKVRSFNDNLLTPHGQEVTIDTWMYRAMVPKDHKFAAYGGLTLSQMEANQTALTTAKKNGLKYTGGTAKRTQDIFQGSPSNLKGVDMPSGVGVYPYFSQAVRNVAARRGMDPSAVQAIVWEVARSDAGYKQTDMASVLKPWTS